MEDLHLVEPQAKESLLHFHGPISLLILEGVLGGGPRAYGAGSVVVMTCGEPGLLTDIYLSDTTFFTSGSATGFRAGKLLRRHSYAHGLEALPSC